MISEEPTKPTRNEIIHGAYDAISGFISVTLKPEEITSDMEGIILEMVAKTTIANIVVSLQLHGIPTRLIDNALDNMVKEAVKMSQKHEAWNK